MDTAVDPSGFVTVVERWYADGRYQRKIGDGPWEPVINLHGHSPFVKYAPTEISFAKPRLLLTDGGGRGDSR
jgi:hypothetical protein